MPGVETTTDTAGCKFVQIFGTPGCRIPSVCYSRQYEDRIVLVQRAIGVGKEVLYGRGDPV